MEYKPTKHNVVNNNFTVILSHIQKGKKIIQFNLLHHVFLVNIYLIRENRMKSIWKENIIVILDG